MDSRQSMESVEKKSDEDCQSGMSTPAQFPATDLEKQPTKNAGDESCKEEFKVKWEDGESSNPRNYSAIKKAWITLQLGILAFAASVGSSIISPAEPTIATYTGVSQEVMVLAVSLYVLGFAVGPSLWAPISEMFGRRVSMMPAMLALGVFSIGTAVSDTAAAILVTRFFGGVFGSAPVSNVSAALGDLYEPRTRGTAITFYAVCVVGGPTLGPVIGSALTVTLSWRWTEYIQAIITFAAVALTVVCLPETYPPVLLKRKAQRMRKETGVEAYWHPHEKLKLDLKSIVTKQLTRPVIMLFTEPMVTAIAVYASFVYGLLYLTLEVFPIVYLDERGWPLVSSTLPFLGLFVGVLCAMGINLANIPRYARLVDQNGGKSVPEGRLPPMLLGGVLFVIGLFWFGWTANPSISWIAPTFATGFIGAGFNIIFQQCINFLVDTYGLYAASATAANTLLRSFIAFAFPLVARPMFHNLGVGPGMSLLGGIACLALPVPLIFMRYGKTLRMKSRFPIE